MLQCNLLYRSQFKFGQMIMNQNRMFLLLAVLAAPSAFATQITIVGEQWYVNNQVTNPGSSAEGLLMNVRMVNATFEDREKPDFDAEANTDRFIAKIPEYAACGVNAFTLCLQGGMPGYEGAVNSAFAPDGELRSDYLQRVERVVRACDQHGVAVILGLYYQRQSKILRDEPAVRDGVINAVQWIVARGFENVVVEIANEYPHAGFAHHVIRDAAGQASLLKLAKQTAPSLLFTASGYGNGIIHPEVAAVCDFLTPHWNGVKVNDIPARVAALKHYHKPIVVNEDDKTDEQAVLAMQASIENGAAYGLMLKRQNQTCPFHFDGADDDTVFYAAHRIATSRAAVRSPAKDASDTSDYFPPSDVDGGWRVLKSEDEVRRIASLDLAKLDKAYEIAQQSTQNGGLLVVRHGWLAYERYFGNGHREATANLASCGKSFTSIAVGMLMTERPDLFPEGLDEAVFTPRHFPPEAFPLSDTRKAKIKLGQLLAFTAGIRGNNPCFVNGRETMIEPPGPDGWAAMVDAVALGREEARDRNSNTSTTTLWCEPGEGYSYASSSIHLASIMLRHVSGEELEDYLDERLASYGK